MEPVKEKNRKQGKKRVLESIENERTSTCLRVHLVVHAVYDRPHETGSWNLHCKWDACFTHFSPNVQFNPSTVGLWVVSQRRWHMPLESKMMRTNLATADMHTGLYSHRCLSAINTNGNQRRVDLEHMSVTQVMFYLSCFLGFAQISILILCNCQNQQAEHNQHGETRRI